MSQLFVPARHPFPGLLLACWFVCGAHAQQGRNVAAATPNLPNLPEDPAVTLGLHPAVSPAASVELAAVTRVAGPNFLRGSESFGPIADAPFMSASLDEAEAGPKAGAAQGSHGDGVSPIQEGQSSDAAHRTGQQPKRILGLMPNYRSVSSGVTPPPPTVEQNFKVATRQAFDYSAFVFLGITSAAAYAQGSHPSLDTYNGGDAVFWGYLWRGFVDKTDGNYLAAFILPTLLREDTRYYALGSGSKWKRLGYAASRVAIARTYHGHTTPNLAGIGGKVAAQAISPYYYPPGSSDFGVLATKFAYAIARDMGFTVFREFYPDIAIHVLHRNP